MTAAVEKTKPKTESRGTRPEHFREALEGAAWVGTNLTVTDDEKFARIRRRALSASTAQKVAQCPAQLAAETVLPRISDPLGAAELGTGAHAVLEALYDLPPQERVPGFIASAAPKVAAQELAPYKGVRGITEVRRQYVSTIEAFAAGIFALEDPASVNVFRTEWDIRNVELSNGVPFVGYLDRTDFAGEPGDENLLSIRDYKFGAKVKTPSQRFGDHYGDQMRLYDEAIFALTGVHAQEALLLWPRQGRVVAADLSEPARRATLIGFKRSWEQMNAYADTRSFPTNPSALCAWCPLANACPVAAVKSDKAIEQAKKQPSAVDLGIPTIPKSAPAPRIDGAGISASQEDTMTETVQYPTNKWAAIAVTRLADVAGTHLSYHGQPVNRTTLTPLTRLLGAIVEQATRDLFGTFDWSHDAASRMSYAVESSIKNIPAPFGGDEDAWKSWARNVTNYSVAKMRAGIELLGQEGLTADVITDLVANTQALPKDVWAATSAQ